MSISLYVDSEESEPDQANWSRERQRTRFWVQRLLHAVSNSVLRLVWALMLRRELN